MGLCNRFFLVTLFATTAAAEFPRRASDEAPLEDVVEDPYYMCADLCREEVKEGENDVMSLATSFLLVQAIRYTLTGILPNIEGLEEPAVFVGWQCVISLLCFGAVCMFMVVLLVHTKVATKYRQARIFQNTLGMSLSWCLFWSTRWVLADSDTLKANNAHPETMEGRILLALTLSGLALSLIFGLDHIQDMGDEASEMGSVIQNFINALSILVGFSWEHSFDFAIESVASKTANPEITKLIFTGAVAFVIVPAWRRHVLVKVIQLDQLQQEESNASS